MDTLAADDTAGGPSAAPPGVAGAAADDGPRAEVATRPRASRGVVAAVIAVGVATALVAGAWSGALAPLLLGDPGPLVRFGLPAVRVVHDLALAAAVGLLLVAAFLTPEARSTHRRATAARLAAVAASVWALTAALGLVLSFSDVSGIGLDDPQYWSVLTQTMWSLELTRLLLIEVVLAALLVPAAAVARTRGGLAWTFALALLAVVPLSYAGHASGQLGHEQAMTGLLIHLVAVALWVGGLLALVLLHRVLGSALTVTVQRFSVVALWCYVAVAGSGVLFALVQITSWSQLTSAYAVVLAAKVAVLAALGWFGVRQRAAIVAGGLERRGAFARFAAVEVVVMSVAIGLGVALSRTPTPGGELPTTTDPVIELTQYPRPQPLEAGSWLTVFQPFWLFLIVAVVAVGAYLVGVRRLARRGDRWPLRSTVCWVFGWALLVYATSGAPGVYGRVMFSMHMVMHMALMMAVPIFLVLGRALTLALRALPARRDKTLGPRELMLLVLHSRWAGFVANPVVAAVLFFGSLVGFYWSDLLELALTTHTGHVLMVVHFVGVGYLFVWSLIGTDPGPRKWPAPLRLVVLFATLAGHAFFALALMSGSWLLAPGFYKALDLAWVPDLLADQQLGGSIAWGIGEVPTLFLAMLVALDWLRRDDREAKRMDRAADRDGDAELAAYNLRLQGLAGGGAPQAPAARPTPETTPQTPTTGADR